MKKPIIAVDIDDVLSKTAQGFIEYSNKTWGHDLIHDDYAEDWAKVWGTPADITMERSVHIHQSGLFGEMMYFSEAHDVLLKLREQHSLVIVTSRRSSIEKLSLEWISRYYAGIFDGVYFTGIFDDTTSKLAESVKRSKNELLHEVGG